MVITQRPACPAFFFVAFCRRNSLMFSNARSWYDFLDATKTRQKDVSAVHYPRKSLAETERELRELQRQQRQREMDALLVLSERQRQLRESERRKPTEAEVRVAMLAIKALYAPDAQPPFAEIWAALKARLPGVRREQAREALSLYAPNLIGQRGKRSKH